MRRRNRCETCHADDGCWAGPETKCHSSCKLRQLTDPIYLWGADKVELNLYPNLSWAILHKLESNNQMFPNVKIKPIDFETKLKAKVKSILDGEYSGKNKKMVKWVNENKLSCIPYSTTPTQIS